MGHPSHGTKRPNWGVGGKHSPSLMRSDPEQCCRAKPQVLQSAGEDVFRWRKWRGIDQLPITQARTGFIALENPPAGGEMRSPPSQGAANNEREPAGW